MSARGAGGLAAAERDLPGRAADLAVVRAAIDADASIAIVGEAGVGKTTLVQAALAASGRRWRAGGGFGTLSWAPFLALERAIGRRLVDADELRAVRAVTTAVGDGILFIDDLQWVDPASRAVLVQLVGRLPLVVAVRRGDPATDVVLAGMPSSVRRHDLLPLDEVAATEVARALRPGLDGEAARRIARRAGGNPLLIGELAEGGEGAPTLAAAVRIRLDGLSPEGRDAFTLLALAGRPMAPADLGSGAGVVAASGLAVVEGDGRLRARHDLLAEAAVAACPDAERRTMHLRLAGTLAEPGEAARHLAAAGERARAHALALEAVRLASTPGERGSHLALAAETADGDAALDLRVRASRALSADLDPDRALTVLGDARGAPIPSVALAEAHAHRLRSEPDAARAAIARGLAALEPAASPDAATEVALRVERARIALSANEEDADVVASARVAHRLAVEHGVGIAAARSVLGTARDLAGDPGGLDDMRAGMETAISEGDLALGMSIGGGLIFALLKHGHAGEGRALAERLRALAASARLAGQERHLAGWALGCAWHAGDFEDALAMARGLASDDLGTDGLVDWYLIQVLADLGRLDEARIRAERSVPGAHAGEYDLGEALWAVADVACLAGRWADAVAAADAHAREIPRARHRIFVEVAGAWATVELGRAPAWPSRWDVLPMADGGPIELEALLELAAGRPGEAAEGFTTAADAWAGRHARGELRCRWASAECLRRAGDLLAARAALLDLESRLESLGHVPFLVRTRRSLRLLGIRRAAGRRSVPGSPLTARESEILSMSGKGMRDAEIATRLGVSRWAVIRAAESAAAKLGAASRMEALAAVASTSRRGGPADDRAVRAGRGEAR
ncbi:MAG: LuxR C-terminal-related transcriptional regulator [Chloroflexi bacterium]|nr:LuxR C-terminal-related transcriptional regulator [Chloroflexota bacterium]